MSNLFLQVCYTYAEPFSSDDFGMLDEALDDFISPKSSTKTLKVSKFQRIINTITPQLVIYPPSNHPQSQNQCMLIIGPLSNNQKAPSHILKFSRKLTQYNHIQKMYHNNNITML